MSDIQPAGALMNDFEISDDAPISEYLLHKISANINEFANGILPVGTIIPSMLTQAQIDGEMFTANIWKLANGGSCVGTAYGTLTGSSTLPDLRGLFLRGKNNGRGDGVQNPDGDLALLALQTDANKAHSHNVTGNFGRLIRVGPTSLAPPIITGQLDSSVAYTSSSSGSEMCPECVTINFFIRVN